MKIGSAASLMLFSSGCLENWGDYQFLSGPNGWSGATRYDDADTDLRFDIAATSMEVSQEPELNRATMLDRIDEIVDERPSVQIVLFGETITGWYRVGDDEENEAYQRSVAETLPGPTSDAIAAAAQAAGIYVAFGIAQADGDRLYNALVLIDPEGEIQAVHHKYLTVHSDVVSSLDNPYTNGDGPTVTEIGGVPFGLLTCNDMHSERIAEGFADAGVEVVLSALADEAEAVEAGGWSPISPVYNAWVVQANRFGAEGDFDYPGAASILDPAGTVRASLNGDGWVAESIGVYP